MDTQIKRTTEDLSNKPWEFEPARVLCRNCGSEAPGKFCSHCGAESVSERFTLKNFFEGTLQNVFDLHKGLLYTMLELTKRPGPLLYEYIRKGEHRQALYNPVKYFLLAFTVSVIQSKLYGVSGIANLFGQMLNLPGWAAELEALLNASILIALSILVTVALQLERAYGYNFAETLIYLLYTSGHFLFIYPTLTYPLGLIHETVSIILNVSGIFVYFSFAVWFGTGFLSSTWGRTLERLSGAFIIAYLYGALYTSTLIYFFLFLKFFFEGKEAEYIACGLQTLIMGLISVSATRVALRYLKKQKQQTTKKHKFTQAPSRKMQ